jgi:hypothetical protein
LEVTTDHTELVDEGLQRGDNAYSMSYMLEHIKRSKEVRTSGSMNPRQELIDYLSDTLRPSGTDIIKWWAVSNVVCYQQLD